MDLNIRRVDRESVKELKREALEGGESLRELAIRRLGIRAERVNGSAGAVVGSGDERSVVRGSGMDGEVRGGRKKAQLEPAGLRVPDVEVVGDASGVEDRSSSGVPAHVRVASLAVEQPAPKRACKECGGLGGVHQRGCKK